MAGPWAGLEATPAPGALGGFRMEFLVMILGAAALLLWGLRMTRTGIQRAFGAKLHAFLQRTMTNRVRAFAGGVGLTCLLQSSTATALLASSFAGRKVVGTSAALAIMLGADVGTSLVAQIYSHRIGWLSPLMILIGWVMFTHAKSSRAHDLGRAIVGLGIALLGLSLIGQAAMPLRQSPILPQLLSIFSNMPMVGVAIGAALTVLSSSSLATVLLVVSFATGGVVSPELGFAMILGANLGSAAMPIISTLSDTAEARRVPLGNAIFRAVGVVIAVPALPYIIDAIGRTSGDAGQQLLNFHTAFNVALALIFLPCVGRIAKLTVRVIADAPESEDAGKPRYLSKSAMESPSVALANAGREALRLGDSVARMLSLSLGAFTKDDKLAVKNVAALDGQVDTLNHAIKMYLTDLSRDIVTEEEQRRIIDTIGFTTNLEHIGDILDKSLMEIAAKKMKYGLQFSAEGAAEIAGIHRRLNANVELAMNVFMTRDVALARKLFAEKETFRQLEKQASEAHLTRLREGRMESRMTSGLHLDILRDLKRINSHLTAVAEGILDGAGELNTSRLKPAA
jgi:phosphate:Na+ symporter